MMKSGREAKYKIVEAVLFVCLFVAGVGIRIWQMPAEMYGVGTYFDAAAVGNYKPVPYITGTGITQIYLYMLRGLFSIFGNIWQVGNIAQLVLFAIGAMVFYFAIRKVNGRVGSLLIAGCVLCLPWFLPITYVYGPQMLFFLLFGVGLYYTHVLVMDCQKKQEMGIILILQTIITGLYGGLLIYLDLFSVLLVLPIIFVPFLLRNGMGAGKGVLVSLVWVISAVAAVFVCGFGESMLAQMPVGDVMELWLQNSYNQLFWDHRAVSYISFEVLLRDRHIWLGIIMVATYISVMVYFVIYLLFQRTTRAVRELDVEGLLVNQTEGSQKSGSAAEQKAEVPVQTAVTEKEVTEPVKEEKVEATLEPEKEEPKPVVHFIENPLPLPKKHVKKTLGYAFEPDFEDMDYDIRVSEKDDYDLK